MIYYRSKCQAPRIMSPRINVFVMMVESSELDYKSTVFCHHVELVLSLIKIRQSFQVLKADTRT
jgi:hypothetical protein